MNYDKALAEVRSQLHQGEQVVAETKATLRQIDAKGKQGDVQTGAAVLTTARLMFVGSLLMQKTSFSVPLQAITSIDGHRQAFVNYSVVTVQGGVSHRFQEFPAEFKAAIENARYALHAAPPQPYAPPTAPAPAPAPIPTADPIAQLERLAALHQAGSLNDQEFAAAKARLLGL